MAVLKAVGLQKSYKRRMVVSDVSLEVGTGQIVGLLGPNGAGKTTSFYMIVGLVQRDAGLITIDDQDISLQPMHVRARNGIGYLPQEASIFRRLSVFDNLMGVMQTRKGLSREESEDKVQQLLEEFNITHIRDNLGQSLSGGERRRVEIARKDAQERGFSAARGADQHNAVALVDGQVHALEHLQAAVVLLQSFNVYHFAPASSQILQAAR